MTNPFTSTSNTAFADKGTAKFPSQFDRQKPSDKTEPTKDVAVKTGPFAQFGGVAKQAPKKDESQNASFGGSASIPTPSGTGPTSKDSPSLTSNRPSLIDEMDSVIATRGISDSIKKESADKAAKFDKLGSGSAGIQSFIEKDGDSSDGSRKGPIILPAAGSAGEASTGGIESGKDVASAQQKLTTGGSAAGEKEKSREGPILLGAPKSKAGPGPSPALATNPFDRVGSKDVLSPSGSSVPIASKQDKESPAQKTNPFDQFASSPRSATVSGPTTVSTPTIAGDKKSAGGIPAPNVSRKANPFDQFSSQSPAVDSSDTKKPESVNPFDQFAKPKPSVGGTSQPSFGAKANGDAKQTTNPFDKLAKPKPSVGGTSQPSFGAKANGDTKLTTNPFGRFSSGTPEPTKSNVPIGQPLQDSEKPQSIGSSEQKSK